MQPHCDVKIWPSGQRHAPPVHVARVSASPHVPPTVPATHEGAAPLHPLASMEVSLATSRTTSALTSTATSALTSGLASGAASGRASTLTSEPASDTSTEVSLATSGEGVSLATSFEERSALTTSELDASGVGASPSLHAERHESAERRISARVRIVVRIGHVATVTDAKSQTARIDDARAVRGRCGGAPRASAPRRGEGR